MVEFLYSIDKAVFIFFNRTVANQFFDWIMPFITETSHWRIPFGLAWLALMVFGGKKGRIAGLLTVILITLSDQISSSVIKPLVHRVRPCFAPELEGVCRLLIRQVRSYSFPSSHATNNTAIAMFFILKYRKWSVPLALVVLFSVLSTYSRVYVGVHYPSDLIGGALLGTLCALAVLQFEILIRRMLPITGNRLRQLKKGGEPSKDEV
jgi:undecaprenyl-diphosphatase